MGTASLQPALGGSKAMTAGKDQFRDMGRQTVKNMLEQLHGSGGDTFIPFAHALKQRYSVNLNFHDLLGLSTLEPRYETFFQAHIYHNNPFCNYVKKSRKGFKSCVAHKETLCSHCRSTAPPFYGKCPLGIEEFVFPVYGGDSLVALICAGQFASRQDDALKRLHKKAARLDLNEAEAERLFRQNTRPPDFSLYDFYQDMRMLSGSLSRFFADRLISGFSPLPSYSALLSREERLAGNFPSSSQEAYALSEHKKSFIVDNTLRFIKANRSRELSLEILAANSFCNPSYLSYLFKEKMKVNVVDYIHQMRMESAGHLLNITDKSITEIALLTGYNDSGYFSKVFHRHFGMSPSRYRKKQRPGEIEP